MLGIWFSLCVALYSSRNRTDIAECVQEVETVDRVESVILSPAQPTSVSLPLESPCWLFYRHAYGIGSSHSMILRHPLTSSVQSLYTLARR